MCKLRVKTQNRVRTNRKLGELAQMPFNVNTLMEKKVRRRTLNKSKTPTSATATPKVPAGALFTHAATRSPECELVSQILQPFGVQLTAIGAAVESNFISSSILVLH